MGWFVFHLLGFFAWLSVGLATVGGHYGWWEAPAWDWWWIAGCFVFIGINSLLQGFRALDAR